MYEELIAYGSPATVGPAVEPISVEQLAAFSHFDAPDPTTDAADYALIQGFISAAREEVENQTGYALITQAWRLSIDRFPGFPINSTGVSELLPSVPYYMPFYEPSFYQVDPTNSSIELMRKKVQSIIGITYIDPSGDEQTFDSSMYTLFANTISLKHGNFWPTCMPVPDCVRISYVCGFGDTAASVPQRLRTSVLYLAGHFYENRSLVAVEKTSDIANTMRLLLSGFRKLRVAK